jgi:hypothetical protein
MFSRALEVRTGEQVLRDTRFFYTDFIDARG